MEVVLIAKCLKKRKLDEYVISVRSSIATNLCRGLDLSLQSKDFALKHIKRYQTTYMKKQSLKTKLYHLIKDKQSVSYGEVCQFTIEEGYRVETMSRRLRELTERSTKHPEVHIGKIIKKSRRNTDYIAAYFWLGTQVQEPKTKWTFVEVDGQLVARQV